MTDDFEARVEAQLLRIGEPRALATPTPSSIVDRIAQLEADLAEAIRWRDIYLRERNEERATFFRRAGELWQPLYDHAAAKAEAAKAPPFPRASE